MIAHVLNTIWVAIKAGKEGQDGTGEKSKNFTTDEKVELANSKVALRVLESSASTERLAIRSTIDGLDSLAGSLRTAPEKLQVPRVSLTARFDHLKKQCSSVRAAEAAVQERVESNLRNYHQTLFKHNIQSTEAY